jgi:hypothetical protein
VGSIRQALQPHHPSSKLVGETGQRETTIRALMVTLGEFATAAWTVHGVIIITISELSINIDKTMEPQKGVYNDKPSCFNLNNYPSTHFKSQISFFEP